MKLLKPMSPYAALNPFIATSVGENDVWSAAAFQDVPEINAVPYGALRVAVEQVRGQRRSMVRFVRGAGGSGKSHLFARLRRESSDRSFYAYAPNPPLQPEALESFVLSRFVNSLRHPARTPEGQEAPFSQLRLLAYALLKPVVEQDITLYELHDAWAEISLESRKELIHQAVQLLEADHPSIPRSVLRCLLSVLREDKEQLAGQWLSGAAYLTENELKYLQVPEPLARSEAGTVLQLFGRLAAQAGGPVILVLDQLDLVVSQQQFDEIQRLLFSLIDQSENWVVMIGLVAERFAAWDAALSQALRGRVGVPDTNAPLGFRLPVIDILPVANEQKRSLLRCRLQAANLVAQRQKDGITSLVHPLLDEDIAKLTAGGAIFPRHLIGAAAEVYNMRVMQPQQAATEPVADVPQAASTMVEDSKPVSLKGETPPGTATPVTPPSSVPVMKVEASTAPPPPSSVPSSSAKDAPAAVVPVVMPVMPSEVAKKATAPVVVQVVKDEGKASVPVATSVVSASAPPVPAKTPLAEKIDALLQKAVEASKAEATAPVAIDLAERARDLIELMAVPPVNVSEGDIRANYDNFDGSDRWFEWGGSKVRIVTSNSMRNSFIAVLERLKDAAGDTLLLRHAVAPVSGQLTLELLNAFKARNVFHHVTNSETALLDALGRMLADMREGSYDQLSTEPPATRDNVLAHLRNHPQLRGIHLWAMIQKAHAPKSSPQQVPPSVLSTIARPAGMTVVKPPPVPGAKPPPPPVPVAKPVPPPNASPVAKPLPKQPSAPVAKPPPGGAPPPPLPPAVKMVPPSKGNAA